jgi:ATP-dependent DNA helicase RecG
MRYPEKESPTLELKGELPSKQQIAKTIIGFCNMFGGRLIIGIDDRYQIIGVDEKQVEQLLEDISRSIHSSCTPSIIPSLHLQRLENKTLVVIEVPEGMTKPYFLSSSGKQEGTFIRVGTEIVKASPQMIHGLEWQSLGKYPDEMPVHSATLDEIELSEVRKFLDRRKKRISGAAIEELLFHFHILTKEHTRTYPTKGGLLLFANNPQKFLPEAFVICTHFFGTSGREVVATRDCTGTLMQQYQDCISFLLSRLNKQFTIKSVGAREEKLEIPEEAIREIVLNALVHRDYLIQGPTKIAIYDDRIEIFSPGNFPGPIKINQLIMGVTYIRNTVLTRVFREIGLIEKFGSGFITLFETYKKWGLPVPIIQEGPGYVKCILPRPTASSKPLENREQSLMELLFVKPEVTVRDIMEAFAISRATANRYLKDFLDKNRIKKIGLGPTTKYIRQL